MDGNILKEDKKTEYEYPCFLKMSSDRKDSFNFRMMLEIRKVGEINWMVKL